MNLDRIPDALDIDAVLGSRAEPREEADRVEIGILGPLEVVGADGPMDLRGAKRRSLMALLAVHAGQWLSLDRIVDELWDGESKPGAGRTVQTYLSQFRRLFDGTTLAIPSRGTDYQLDVPLEHIDSWRFEQMVRHASDLDDLAERRALVDAALALWRATPLAEFDQPWAIRERARLDLLRLQARDVQLDARLALGADHDLVGELEQLVDAQPLDERFWAKLLLAYYRSGRQADALRAFQRARTILAEELGIDPGPELVQLEQRILQHDPALLGPSDAYSSSGSALPTGTVTFLFTDIMDSTRLWETRPDVMEEAIPIHHRLLTDTIEGNGGHVVKRIGDGLMAVFAEASNASRAAIEAQSAMIDTAFPVDVKVRIGLHTGSAHLVDGDYHAPTVNRAARIAAAAHPGQILVSEVTASLSDGVQTRDLGEYELRGLAPIRVHQLLDPRLPSSFPRSPAASAVDLPAPPTSFIGRGEELESLHALVDANRLVTITGVGGCGKTRVAIETARTLADRYADGAKFVDLAAVADEAAVDDAISDGIGLAADLGGDASRRRVVEFIAHRQLLVVLDNCEHLLDVCAGIVEAVLEAGGDSRILITSREPLGVIGERVVVLPSMQIESDAVQLFEDRAQSVGANFTLDETNRPIVIQICRRLDGIPLAIELAAARVAHLSPTQILDRLDDRFRLLTGGRRRVQRQHTLAATLDWSHDLLDADDQQVLRELAVFPASFTLEAAEAVLQRADALDRLASLVDKSLVTVHTDGPSPRYRLLETVRLYAEAKLVESGEADHARTRHRDWLLEWLESVPLEHRWLGDDNVFANAFPSVRAAIEWSMDQDDVTTAATIAAGVDWVRSEGWSEGARWCGRLADEPRLSDELRAQLFLELWWLDPMQRQSRSWGARAVQATERGTSPLGAMAVAAKARDCIVPAADTGDAVLREQAIELGEQAVEMSADGPSVWHSICRFTAGMVYASFRQAADAAAHFRAGMTPIEGPFDGLAHAHGAYLAIMRFCTDDMDTAAELARAHCATDMVIPYQHSRPAALVALAAEGDLPTARAALHDYSRVTRASDWPYNTESVAVLAGVLAGLDGDWERAAVLLAAGRTAVYRDPANSILYFTYRDKARQELGHDRAQTLRAEGVAVPRAAVLDLALR